MNRNTETTMTAPVLIVGAGPAGLVAAITLARHGIASLLVEKRAGLSPFPRATAISTRTMELIRSWGLEDRVRAGEIDARPDGWVCTTLASPDGMAVPMGFPTRARAHVVSPTAPALAPQDHLQPVLLAHLRDQPLADIRFDTELVTLDQDDEGVTAVLRHHGLDRRRTTVRCSFVIGADGARSTVRAGLGIGMHGLSDEGDFLTVLFRAPLHDVVGDRRHGLYMIQGSARPAVFVPAGDRWLYSRATEGRDAFSAAEILELIRAGAGVPDLPVDILRVGTFAFAAQIAERYRDRRVFLAGDAAHRITPRGGTGMNTAIHDAYDLAWKLGWVLNKWAPAELLDSYETERRPVGLRNTTNSAQPQRDQSDTFANDLAGRLPHVWQHHGSNRMSTLDLLGPGLTLLTGPHGPTRHHLAAPLPLAVHTVDTAAAAAFEIGTGGAVLVRPDGQITRRWPAAPCTTEELRDGIHAAITGRSHPAESTVTLLR
jgi:putative polyketide hydroxylase